jgi:hypothetical protein
MATGVKKVDAKSDLFNANDLLITRENVREVYDLILNTRAALPAVVFSKAKGELFLVNSSCVLVSEASETKGRIYADPTPLPPVDFATAGFEPSSRTQQQLRQGAADIFVAKYRPTKPGDGDDLFVWLALASKYCRMAGQDDVPFLGTTLFDLTVGLDPEQRQRKRAQMHTRMREIPRRIIAPYGYEDQTVIHHYIFRLKQIKQQAHEESGERVIEMETDRNDENNDIAALLPVRLAPGSNGQALVLVYEVFTLALIKGSPAEKAKLAVKAYAKEDVEVLNQFFPADAMIHTPQGEFRVDAQAALPEDYARQSLALNADEFWKGRPITEEERVLPHLIARDQLLSEINIFETGKKDPLVISANGNELKLILAAAKGEKALYFTTITSAEGQLKNHKNRTPQLGAALKALKLVTLPPKKPKKEESSKPTFVGNLLNEKESPLGTGFVFMLSEENATKVRLLVQQHDAWDEDDWAIFMRNQLEWIRIVFASFGDTKPEPAQKLYKDNEKLIQSWESYVTEHPDPRLKEERRPITAPAVATVATTKKEEKEKEEGSGKPKKGAKPKAPSKKQQETAEREEREEADAQRLREEQEQAAAAKKEEVRVEEEKEKREAEEEAERTRKTKAEKEKEEREAKKAEAAAAAKAQKEKEEKEEQSSAQAKRAKTQEALAEQRRREKEAAEKQQREEEAKARAEQEQRQADERARLARDAEAQRTREIEDAEKRMREEERRKQKEANRLEVEARGAQAKAQEQAAKEAEAVKEKEKARLAALRAAEVMPWDKAALLASIAFAEDVAAHGATVLSALADEKIKVDAIWNALSTLVTGLDGRSILRHPLSAKTFASRLGHEDRLASLLNLDHTLLNESAELSAEDERVFALLLGVIPESISRMWTMLESTEKAKGDERLEEIVEEYKEVADVEFPRQDEPRPLTRQFPLVQAILNFLIRKPRWRKRLSITHYYFRLQRASDSTSKKPLRYIGVMLRDNGDRVASEKTYGKELIPYRLSFEVAWRTAFFERCLARLSAFPSVAVSSIAQTMRDLADHSKRPRLYSIAATHFADFFAEDSTPFWRKHFFAQPALLDPVVVTRGDLAPEVEEAEGAEGEEKEKKNKKTEKEKWEESKMKRILDTLKEEQRLIVAVPPQLNDDTKVAAYKTDALASMIGLLALTCFTVDRHWPLVIDPWIIIFHATCQPLALLDLKSEDQWTPSFKGEVKAESLPKADWSWRHKEAWLHTTFRESRTKNKESWPAVFAANVTLAAKQKVRRPYEAEAPSLYIENWLFGHLLNRSLTSSFDWPQPLSVTGAILPETGKSEEKEALVAGREEEFRQELAYIFAIPALLLQGRNWEAKARKLDSLGDNLANVKEELAFASAIALRIDDALSRRDLQTSFESWKEARQVHDYYLAPILVMRRVLELDEHHMWQPPLPIFPGATWE